MSPLASQYFLWWVLQKKEVTNDVNIVILLTHSLVLLTTLSDIINSKRLKSPYITVIAHEENK